MSSNYLEDLFIEEASPALKRHSGDGGAVKVEGTIDISENGTHDVAAYAEANVDVPIPEGYIVPEGVLAIIENGTHDVTPYTEANVAVPQPEGTIQITENGTHDATAYACAEVSVIPTGDGYDALNALIDKSITEVSSNVELVGKNTFSTCSVLTTANFPSATSIGGNAFSTCPALTTANFPSATKIDSSVFYNCKVLTTLVLRSETVCTLSNINAFTGTPFAIGGTGGTVYVPQALIEDYKIATNWSTLYAAGTCNFVAIEGSEYE